MSTWKRVGALVAWLPPAGVLAQPCTPQWLPPNPVPPLSHEVLALTTWDPDGPGPRAPVIVAGGNFLASVGSPSTGVAMWDGSAWLPMGEGVFGTVLAATVFDPDGPGPALAEPVIGGRFTTASGVVVNHVARWDGATWHPLGSGLMGGAIAEANAIINYDGNLVVGGAFSQAGGVSANNIAWWDGAQWHAFSTEPNGGPLSFTIYQGQLVVGLAGAGDFGVKRWTGQTWLPFGVVSPRCFVHAVAEFRGELIAGGTFGLGFCLNPPPFEHIAAWDGTQWRELGGGINGTVRALTKFDPDGPGPLSEVLIAGGSFTVAGGPTGTAAACVAAWDGTRWTSLGDGTSNTVRALMVREGELCAGGSFGFAGGMFTPFFARYGCPPPAPCYADCNQDGALNLADFGCFQTMFSIGDPYADCNGDGVRNIADFGCFMTKFALGCP